MNSNHPLQLDFLLHAASRHLTRIFKEKLDPYDLTYTQYLVLLCLKIDHPLSVDTIGDALYLDSGTLTPLLKRLESKNFIQRRRSQIDERKLDITLTDQGKEIQENLSSVTSDIYKDFPLHDSLPVINQLLEKLILLFQQKNEKR